MKYEQSFYSIYLLLFCFAIFSGASAYAMMEDEEGFPNQRSGISKVKQEEFPAIEEVQEKPSFDVTGLRIDLHGKSLEDAKYIVMNMIQQAYGLNGNEIHFICGRGNHVNKNGQRAVIWKTMPTWLSDPSMASFIDHYTKGLGTYNVILKSPKENSSELRRENIKIDGYRQVV